MDYYFYLVICLVSHQWWKGISSSGVGRMDFVDVFVLLGCFDRRLFQYFDIDLTILHEH